MLYYIPLEHIDKRYTSMQDKVTQKAFKKYKIKYKTVEGKILSNTLTKTQFLNPYSTNYFKFTQLQLICELFNNDKIKDGDSFYFSDLWFPGIESLKYMAYFKGINIKIFGILHAGSFTPSDTVNGMKDWAKHFELSIIKMCDGIFLGSEQTKQDIIKTFDLGYEDLKKLHVTGLAFCSKDVEKYKISFNKKENIIIFPHRIHVEKQKDLFDHLKRLYPSYKFVITQELNLNKEEYYKLLAKSKILFSASLQENFGYAVLEGCTLGVIPILPLNNTDYKYIYPREVLYSSFEEAMRLIDIFMNKNIDLTHIPKFYDNSLDRQCEVMVQNGIK